MHHVNAQGVDECMINVHYYYYWGYLDFYTAPEICSGSVSDGTFYSHHDWLVLTTNFLPPLFGLSSGIFIYLFCCCCAAQLLFLVVLFFLVVCGALFTSGMSPLYFGNSISQHRACKRNSLPGWNKLCQEATTHLAHNLPHPTEYDGCVERQVLWRGPCEVWSPPGHSPQSNSLSLSYQRPSLVCDIPGLALCWQLSCLQRNQQVPWPHNPPKWPKAAWIQPGPKNGEWNSVQRNATFWALKTKPSSSTASTMKS